MIRLISCIFAASICAASFAVPMASQPWVTNRIASAIAALPPSGVTTNDVCNIVTNEVAEWSEFSFRDNIPERLTGDALAAWREISQNPGNTGVFHLAYDGRYWILDIGGMDATDPLVLSSDGTSLALPEEAFWSGLREYVGLTDGEVIATRTRITRNALGLARMSDIAPSVSNTVTKAYVEDLGIESGMSAETATNIASTVSSSAVANADTTYRRTIGITNINQSVQYVNITDETPSTLAITMPTDGVTKDWIVYVTSVTNVSLVLPSATYWMADIAYTNDVPPATPTALWFSQVTDGIFILGRQELTPVTITTEE